MGNYTIYIQRNGVCGYTPKLAQMKQWCRATLINQTDRAEVVIRLVATQEMTALNQQYRKKNGPTNVLSFPFEGGMQMDEPPFLGDIVICAEVVNQEASLQNKSPELHWAHIIVHGTLHLLGFDHSEDLPAQHMEALESKILKTMGFPNPYQ